MSLKFNILEHKKPINIQRKEILFDILPNIIAEQLHGWFNSYYGFVIFEVDDDFNIRNSNTHDFIDKLFKNIFHLIVGKDDIVAIIKSGGIHKATIKKKFGRNVGSNMYFRAQVSNIKQSRGIQIIDIILGLVLSKRCKFRFDRLFLRKVC